MNIFSGAGVDVFPTPVGMNRGADSAGWQCHRVPHTRGDEPLSILFQP